MSDAKQTVIPNSHRDLLDAPLLAHLATIGPNGEPQSNPVWFVWHDEQLLIGMEPDRQKYRNLQREPRLSISIVDPLNPGRYLEIRGCVVEFDRDPAEARLRLIIRKYTGVDELAGEAGGRGVGVVLAIRSTQMGENSTAEK